MYNLIRILLALLPILHCQNLPYFTQTVNPIYYKLNDQNILSRIFTTVPIELQKTKKLGFLLGLNETIALMSDQGEILSQLNWKADYDARTECQGIQRQYILECHNLIRIIEPVTNNKKYNNGSYNKNKPIKADQFLACGTFASQTKCRTFYLNSNKIISWDKKINNSHNSKNNNNNNKKNSQKVELSKFFVEKTNGTECYVPRLSSSSALTLTYRNREGDLNFVSAITENNLRTGNLEAKLYKFNYDQYSLSPSIQSLEEYENLKQSRNKYAYNENMKHILTGNDFSNIPVDLAKPETKFLKLLNLEGRTILFYTDKYGSKLASTCLEDYGRDFKKYQNFDNSNLQLNQWTSFVQASIQCQHNNVTYRHLISVGEIFKIQQENYILAAFTLDDSLSDLIQSSVICVYKFSDIFSVLSGLEFKESLNSNTYEPTFGYKIVKNPFKIYYKSSSLLSDSSRRQIMSPIYNNNANNFNFDTSQDEMLHSRAYQQSNQIITEKAYQPGKCENVPKKDKSYTDDEKYLSWQKDRIDLNQEIFQFSDSVLVQKTFTSAEEDKFKILTITNEKYEFDSDAIMIFFVTDTGYLFRYSFRLLERGGSNFDSLKFDGPIRYPSRPDPKDLAPNLIQPSPYPQKSTLPTTFNFSKNSKFQTTLMIPPVISRNQSKNCKLLKII